MLPMSTVETNLTATPNGKTAFIVTVSSCNETESVHQWLFSLTKDYKTEIDY